MTPHLMNPMVFDHTGKQTAIRVSDVMDQTYPAMMMAGGRSMWLTVYRTGDPPAISESPAEPVELHVVAFRILTIAAGKGGWGWRWGVGTATSEDTRLLAEWVAKHGRKEA